LAGLLILALIVRGGVLWSMRDNLEVDPDAYREIAENLLRHGEFALGKTTDQPTPTAYRPPLYPVVLSNLPAADGEHVSLGKVAVLHLLLGVATVWLTYLTARRWMASGRREPPEDRVASGDSIGDLRYAPLVAGVLVACDPILLNQQTLVMTETLAAFLAILSLWCLARFDADASWFNAALAGGAIGLAALCRPTFLPWLGIVGLGILLLRRTNAEFRNQNSELQRTGCWWSWRGLVWRVANVAALGITAAMVMSPWVIRNQREFGKPIVTTTHGGYTLWLGNNVSFYDWLRNSHSELPWDVDRDRTGPHRQKEALMRVNILFASLDDLSDENIKEELSGDLFERRIALKTIERDPSGFALACRFRIGQLWSPLPNKLTLDESTGRMLLRYATAAWYCGVYVLVAVGVWRLRWKLLARPWIWGVLLCLTFTAVHTFYWSNLRMRAPLMPFVAIVAAVGLARTRTNTKGKTCA
jgi:hypothetical protein